jgi:hypothetical protein
MCCLAYPKTDAHAACTTCSIYDDSQLPCPHRPPVHLFSSHHDHTFLEGMKKNRRRSKKGKGDAFDPQNETLVEHRKLGVWDLYIERDSKLSLFPTSWKIEEYLGMWNDLPYLWRTMRDVGSVAWPLLLLYVAITAAGSLIPALSLWCVSHRPSFFLGDVGLLNSFPGSLGSCSTL